MLECIGQGWRTYGTCAQNGTRKDSLVTRHLLLSRLLVLLPDKRLYIETCMRIHTHIHIPDCVDTVYELPVLPNNTAGETFLHKPVGVRSVDWIFIIGMPAWRWLGKYVTLDKRFYNILSKQEAVQAPVTSKFSSLSRALRRPELEICCTGEWFYTWSVTSKDVNGDQGLIWENRYISDIRLDKMKIPLQNHDNLCPKDIYTDYHKNHTFYVTRNILIQYHYGRQHHYHKHHHRHRHLHRRLHCL
jgi:hypothetical protein